MTLLLALVALVLGATAALAAKPHPRHSHGHPVPAGKLRHSIAHPPVVSSPRFGRLGRGRLAVRFQVRYPPIGRLGRERVGLRFRVFGSRARGTAVVLRKRRRLKPATDRTSSYRFVVRGKPARKLLRKLGANPEAASQLVGLTVLDSRDIVPGSGIDHLLISTSLDSSHKGIPVTIANRTPDYALTDASKMACVYGDGIDDLNGIRLDPGSSEALAEQTPNTVTADIHSAEVHPDESGGAVGPTLETPQSAAGFSSPELRALAFQVYNHHKGGLAPKYEAQIEQFFPSGFCEHSSHKLIALGLEDLDNGGHDLGLWDVRSGKVALDSALEANVGVEIVNVEPPTGIVAYEAVPFPPSRNGSGECLYWNWMQCAYPPGSQAEAQTRLMDVVWPGTHDSGTTVLGTEQIEIDTEPSSPCTSASGFIGWLESMTSERIQKLGVTQANSLREQLDSGIRYLDVRVGWNPNAPHGGGWQIVHTMFSRASLASEMEAVATWTMHHPGEVVILNFPHICGMTAANVGKFYEALEDADTRYDVPGGAAAPSVCDQAYPLSSGGETPLAAQTLGEVRASGKSIVLMARSNSNLEINRCPLRPTFNEPPSSLRAMGVFEADEPQLTPSAHGDTELEACVNRAIAHLPFAASASCPEAFFETENIFGRKTNNYPPFGLDITNYREAGKAPIFLITDLHYEFSEEKLTAIEQIVQALVAGGLIKWERSLLPGVTKFDRSRIIAAWGRCANVIVADDYASSLISGHANDYVNQIVGIDQYPEAHPCVDPGNPGGSSLESVAPSYIPATPLAPSGVAGP